MINKITNKIIHKDEKILIAGSQGMVGSAIKRALINQGYGGKVNSGVI